MAPVALPELPGVTHRDLIVNGVRLHVAEAGEGPPIVMQHGWPQNWWAWRKVIPALAERHRVICPDLRGFGWSDAPPGRYDKESLASDLLAVLDLLGHERVLLVGHDWGGWVGFLACLRAPERFSGYLALAIAHPWVGGGRVDPRRLLPLWYQFVLASPAGPHLVGREGVMRRVLERAGEGVLDEQAIGVYAATLAQPASARASSELYRTFLLREAVPVARGRYRDARLRVPTRLVVGDRDPVLEPETVGGLDAHADDATTDWIAGGTHWLPEQYPERVLEEITRLS